MRRTEVSYIVRTYLSMIVTVAILFAAAGSIYLWRVWLFFGVWSVTQAISIALVRRSNPGLLHERGQRKKDTERWDFVVFGLYALIMIVGMPVVAGLDLGRYGWTQMPVSTVIPGIALYVIALALATWAMAVNPHFESTARIQSDRGHRVVDFGPYKYIRHPGYLGGVLGLISFPLILGSLAAYIPVGLAVILFVIRTALEDATLRKRLPGYADYSRQVRFRILPGIW